MMATIVRRLPVVVCPSPPAVDDPTRMPHPTWSSGAVEQSSQRHGGLGTATWARRVGHMAGEACHGADDSADGSAGELDM
jgi:hypothetical protein